MTTAGPNTRRRIRSFVRRAGRLTPGQRRALDELWPCYGIDDGCEPLDLDAVFGRKATPRVLEIGYGTGEVLLDQAAGAPATDFLGIEVHEPGIGHCLLGLETGRMENVRLIAGDALDTLRHRLLPAQFQRVNLYFPDPWPKKRHQKRRIVQADFLALVARCLRASGHLHIATDWAPYAAHIQDCLAASDAFAIVEHRRHAGDTPLERPTTRFERRGLALGHRIDDWKLQKN